MYELGVDDRVFYAHSSHAEPLIHGDNVRFQEHEKPLITPYSTLHMAILANADTIILTNLQKRENRLNRSSLDNIKKQVA